MSQNPSAHTPLTAVRKIEADGVQVFYRAAGDPSAPVVLLLHGFPMSSFMFRELIPRLADHYRVIASDLPGFGFIITIMVLELKPPPEPSFTALLPPWPTGVSYFFIAIVWVNHHHLLRFAIYAARRLVWWNFAHLFAVSPVPVSTSWVAVTRFAAAPVTVYPAVFVLVNSAYVAFVWEVLRKHRG